MFTVLAGAAMAQQPVDYVDPFTSELAIQAQYVLMV